MAMLESQSRPCPVGAMHDFAPEGEQHAVKPLLGWLHTTLQRCPQACMALPCLATQRGDQQDVLYLCKWRAAADLIVLMTCSMPDHVADTAAKPQHAHAGELVSAYSHYVRDLPGSFDVWVENMADQSHVAFAHHGAVGNRSALPAYLLAEAGST